MRPLFIVTAALTALPVLANAQGRGGAGMARPAMPSMPSRSVVVAAAPAVHAAPGVTAHMTVVRVVPKGAGSHGRPTSTMIRVVPRRTNNPRPANPVFTEDQDFNSDFFPTPGLGFDQAHWAAVHPQGPGTGRHHRAFGAFFPFFDGGFFLTPQTIVEEVPVADGQATEDVQADVVEQPAPAPRTRYYRETAPAPAPVAEPAAAETPHESEQYVFVRRDGTIIFAVAYAYENGSVRYITTEGMRRSVALDALDLDATRQFNEQRGLVFRLPA